MFPAGGWNFGALKTPKKMTAVAALTTFILPELLQAKYHQS